MGNIQNGQIDWGDLVYTSADEDIAKYRMNKGDVLFNRTNSPELVGKTGIYKGEQPSIFAGYLIRIKSSELLNSKYLNYFLNTPYAHELCLKAKTDGVSQSNINAQKLGNFEIPFCRLEEQIEIVRRINTLLEVAVDIQVRYQRANIFVGKLTQSILAKAFRGELVPQDANDEPASELLKRIQAERDQERGKEPKARKRGKPYRKRNKAVQASDQNPEPDNNETPDHQEASPVQVEKESFAQKAKGKPSEFSIQQPLPLVDLDQQTIMAAFRKACRNHSEISRDDLLKAAALNLGYQRLSSKLKVKLQADMRAAMLRKIVRTNGNMIHPATRNADDYAPDDLVKFACSVTKKGKLYEEDTVIRDTLKHLGFQRITSRMRNTVASAIQVGIRSGVFVRDQGMIFRP